MAAGRERLSHWPEEGALSPGLTDGVVQSDRNIKWGCLPTTCRRRRRAMDKEAKHATQHAFGIIRDGSVTLRTALRQGFPFEMRDYTKCRASHVVNCLEASNVREALSYVVPLVKQGICICVFDNVRHWFCSACGIFFLQGSSCSAVLRRTGAAGQPIVGSTERCSTLFRASGPLFWASGSKPSIVRVIVRVTVQPLSRCSTLIKPCLDCAR